MMIKGQRGGADSFQRAPLFTDYQKVILLGL